MALHFHTKSPKQLTKNIVAMLFLGLISFSSAQSHANASNQPAAKNDITFTQKAKIIKYLLGSVVWPKEAIKDASLHVCVLGKLENSKPLNELNGTTINNNKILVSKASFKQSQSDCQLVYVQLSESNNAKDIIKAFAGKPVLLISDIGNFADMGGTMNFVETSGIVALTVNIESVKKSNLGFNMSAYSHITVIPKPSDIAE